jgi:UDP-N-acetylmuramyl pentapeptide phosphotransferase/UDP-N-acetylglucosamine-1-phosphate transferase
LGKFLNEFDRLLIAAGIFVTMINAYNFVDGADGLAGSLSSIL